MERFIDYINSALPDRAGDKLLYKFKKKTLDEMNQRALEVTGRGGIQSRRVIEDLIISEHPDLVGEYTAYHDKETAAARARRAVIGNVLGSIIYLILLVTVFLATSFATQMWKYTWIIIVDGVLLWVDYLLALGIKKFVSMKRIFHIFARLLLFGAVVIAMVAAFLFVVALTDLPHSWLIVIAGLILAFLCDGIFASATKARLAIIHWVLYIPVIATFLYIMLGVLGVVAWGIGWMLIPLSLVLDLILILAALNRNQAEKAEVADIWNEG